MKIHYNTEVLEFDNYDELDEHIVVDDEWKKLYGDSGYFSNYKVVKVWKNGRITDKNNKELKNGTRIKEYLIIKNGKEIECKENIRYWKYGRCDYEYVEIKEIIWEIYSIKYNFNKSLLKDDEFRGLYFKDGDYNNVRLDNLIKYLETNEGTRIYDNTNNYFDFNLKIPNDDDEFIQCDEPVILDHLPYFEIYRNGNIVDTRGKSGVLINKNGYQTISYKKNYFVHRLVALAYLKNRYDYDLVNHLDGNRSNNDVNNLEWVNNSINTLHGQLTNVLSFNANHNSNSVKLLFENRFKYGIISLTSKSYREFIKSRILMELEMEVDLWIFSHKTPLYIIFLPLYREFGQSRFEELNFFDEHFVRFMKYIKDTVYIGRTKLSGLSINEDNDLWLIVETINKYLSPRGKEDHIVNILKILKIDFDKYIDWVFDDIKNIFNDDVGFIFFEELVNYINLMRMSNDDVFVNDILFVNRKFDVLMNIRDEDMRDVVKYDKTYRKMIDYNSNYNRICERLYHYNRYSVKNTKIDYEGDYIDLILNFWTFWKRKY